ncbi:MAG: type I DNA topoisomerase [Lachnospiraceae bacterium]|nr:type I DNA topoisomerase [Lachnospiraceae bacterium]
MANNLVIVESPAKVKTIKKFLGSTYEVTASQGHIRDLPKSTLGVDIENDYEPKYITIRGKGDILASLRKEVKKADKIYLATDPDREGEAISWHLLEGLKLKESGKKVYRIAFNEITKDAVKESLKNARELDMDLVDAQQARRILDRMVGYRISPLLWAKVKRGLSAGRVQSVALRIIADREDEIAAFIPKEYWTVDALFGSGKKSFVAHYISDEDGKKTIDSGAEAEAIENALKAASYKIKEAKHGERLKKQPLPFTTSTLQQEASKVLNFSTSKTMRIAQQLYEGVEIKGQGTVGVITYLRTDSTRVSDEAVLAAKNFINEQYGSQYNAEAVETKKSGKKIQDAHEAIRPTDLLRTPEMMKASLERDQLRLYTLIYKRFLASRMAPAVYNTISLKIDAISGSKTYHFTSSGSNVKFDGFMKVYTNDDTEKAENAFLLSDVDENTSLQFNSLEKKQHFTQPPAHYTEASLVRALEELGIGRPSTYAPTISVILGRRYIIKENKNLYISELGEAVNGIMKEQFPSIVDVNFTATMESLLDKVEEGEVKWKTILRNFYPDLETSVKEAEKNLEKIEIRDEESDEDCDVCGRRMVIKYGPHGKFLACPGFPECRNTKPYLEKIGVACPVCGKDVIARKTQKGRRYFGCSGYPDCDFISWSMPSEEKCPTCGQYLVVKGQKLVCSDQQCGFTKERAQKDE